jgi:hypothetical protein
MLPIWEAFVMPNACRRITVTTVNYVQPTPVHFAATPFNFWRGKLKYRFTFFPSAFHRGKVGILYEPNCCQASLIEANLSLNKNFLAIIDLQTTTEIEVCVEWAYPRYFAAVAPRSIAEQSIGTTANAVALADYANGFITIVPLTKLVSPDGSGVDYNIYVSAEELELAYPDQTKLPVAIVQSDDACDQKDSTCLVLNPTGCSSERAFQLHFGERVTTFRSLLKRFVTTDRRDVVASGITGPTMIQYVGRNVPLLSPTPLGSGIYFSLLSYLRPSYLGMTGGLRKRLRLIGAQSNPMNCAMIQLVTPSKTTVANSTGISVNYVDSTLTGTVMFAYDTNGGVEFELPFYTANLFGTPSQANEFNSALLSSFEPLALRNYYAIFDINENRTYTVHEMTATAEDFCLHCFIAATPYAH